MRTIKQKNKQSLRKKIVFILFTLIIIVLAGAFVAAKNNFNPFKSPVTTPSQSKPASNNPNDQSPQDQPSTSTDGKIPINNEPTPGQPASELGARITSVIQDNEKVQIRTLIDALTNTGECKLTLTSHGELITKTVGIQAQASASTCKGYDIPLTELSKGNWNLAIDITYDDKNIQLTQEITVN